MRNLNLLFLLPFVLNVHSEEIDLDGIIQKQTKKMNSNPYSVKDAYDKYFNLINEYKKKRDSNIKNDEGIPLIFMAALHNDMDLCRYLLKNGVDPNVEIEYGQFIPGESSDIKLPLLGFSVLLKNAELCRLLLDLGAKTDQLKKIPLVVFGLDLAAKAKKELKGTDAEIFLTLANTVQKSILSEKPEKVPSNREILLKSIENNDKKQIILMLNRTYEQEFLSWEEFEDAIKKRKIGPIRIMGKAVSERDVFMVNYLFKLGFSSDYKSFSESSLLLNSTLSMDVFKLFIDSGVKLNFKDSCESTFLMRAVEGDPKVVQYLLENGANVNDIDDKVDPDNPDRRNTALDYLQHLLKRNENFPSSNSKSDQIKIKNLLLKYGAKTAKELLAQKKEKTKSHEVADDCK